MENENALESWDNFVSGNFLKAVNVNSDQEGFLVTDVEQYTDKKDNSTRLRLTLERNGKEFEFDLNKTNGVFLKNNGIASPNDLTGQTIFFKKALVRNPQTNQEVESLRICRVARIV